jgi:hypothetical protein
MLTCPSHRLQNLLVPVTTTTTTTEPLAWAPVGTFRFTFTLYHTSATTCSALGTIWMAPTFGSQTLTISTPKFEGGICTLVSTCGPQCVFPGTLLSVTTTFPGVSWLSMIGYTIETPAFSSAPSTPGQGGLFAVSGFARRVFFSS